MSGQHTQGRLVAIDCFVGQALHSVIDGAIVATVDRPLGYEDARRLAACWNAFLPMSTEDIEAMGSMVLYRGQPVGELAELRAERDQLRAELDELRAPLARAKELASGGAVSVTPGGMRDALERIAIVLGAIP